MLNFDSSIGGLVLMIFVISLIIGYAILMTVLISWIWGTQPELAETVFHE